MKNIAYYALTRQGADFLLVLYNPRSRGCDWQLTAAINLALGFRTKDTPVGLVRQAYKDGQQTTVCRPEDFKPEQADMLSLVLVGNASTYLCLVCALFC